MRRVAAALSWIVWVGAATAVVLLFTLDGGGESLADPAPGAGLYERRCAVCHGADGEGGTGPDLAAAASLRGDDMAAAVAIVTSGRNAMPGFGLELSAAEIESVVAYVQALG